MALNHRSKILLSVLQELGGQLPTLRMQLLLFLYCVEFVKRDEYYEFIPLAGKPYSVQAEADKELLIRKKLLEKSAEWIVRSGAGRYATDLDFFEKIAIQELRNRWAQKSDQEIIAHVAEIYSAPHPLDSNEPVFFTIGYESVSPEAYVNALLKSGVRMLVDVRRNAFSKKYGFSKSELGAILTLAGIEYLHLPELGVESGKRQNLVSNRDYEALFKEYEQTTLAHEQTALDRLQRLIEKKRRIAITCFEADPFHCHRSRVASCLKARDNFHYKIEHLKPCQNHSLLKKQSKRGFL